jgi:translation initiation factor IF-2
LLTKIKNFILIMSEGSSTVRLSKAAREFNVGTNTIVEFLSKKGHQIDPNPNTKLSAEMYVLLVKEYQTEKQVKEVSQKLGIEYSGRKTITAEEVLKKDFEEDEDDDYDSGELLIKNIQNTFSDKSVGQTEAKPKAEPAESKPQAPKELVAVEEIKPAPKVETKEPVAEDVAEVTAQLPKQKASIEIETVAKEEPKPSEPELETVQQTQDVPVVNVPIVEKEREKKTEITAAEKVDSEIAFEKIEEETIIPQPEVTSKSKDSSAQIPSFKAAEESSTPHVEGELKILGKIDLDSMNMRTKPDRKSRAQRQKEEDQKKQEKEKEQAKRVADRKKQFTSPSSQQAQPSGRTQSPPPARPDLAIPKKEEYTQTTKPESIIEKPVEKIIRPDNFLPTELVKLQGVTILDKIVLPEDRRKAKPVASSSEDKLTSAQKKKKRKRIKTKPQGDTPAPSASPSTAPKQQQTPQKDIRRGKPAPPRKEEKAELTEEDIQRQIKETLARLSPMGKSKTSKHRRQKRDAFTHNMAEELARAEHDKSVIKVTEFVTANELATMMNVPVIKVIATCMSLGMAVSINQRLDAETLSLVAEEFGFEVEFTSHDLQDSLAESEEPDNPEDLVERAPIVTVMGHVDHGKTLLLDYIRKANVVAGEAGGITQHIGAYEVFTESGKKIAFLDTPGHEAFTAMRARGAKVTDVAIIVIAADDSVMPQTKEAINHAQAAGVPIVFAFNKVDKPTANTERLREQLANMNILVEDWGGKYQCQEVSAKSGLGIDLLLEKVLLEAEILDLKGNPKRAAKGTVIESALDKGRGYVAKILVQDGTLHQGDIVLAGSVFGKVKAMFNERNTQIKEAGPSTPTLLLGLSGAPQAGDSFMVLHDEKEAKNIAARRQQLQREQGLRTQKHITLDEIGRRIAIGDFKELNLIVKGDVDGSVEALSDSLLKLSTKEVQVNVIHKSVGAITESDIMLASASNAIVIGFQVRPSLQARKIAETEEIDIRLYSIIYTAIEEIKAAIEGMLAPEIEEVITCNIEIREVFRITKVGTVAGCMVLDGKVNRNTKIRIIRDGIVIYSGHLGSLKRFKDDVKEVSTGYECGLNIDGFNDIKVGDIIEGYSEKEVSRKI